MDQGKFANLSWDQAHEAASPVISPRAEAEGEVPGNMSGQREGPLPGQVGQVGRNPDPLDIAGVGAATLNCTVGSPIKENDGSKDAYISYLITTNVCLHQT
jgi:sorting nexin-4